MKRNILNYFILLFVLCGCTSNDGKLFFVEPPVDEEEEIGDDVVALFEERLDLDSPGMEKVKAAYEEGDVKKASEELLTYYRNRDYSKVGVDLTAAPNLSDYYKNVADQTLEYRLYVRGFYEKKEGDREIYYSRIINGKLDWKTRPKQVVSKEYLYQLHRFQWEPMVLAAYRNTKDEKYVESWMRIYSDWMDAFPAPKGIVNNNDDMEWYGLQPAARLRGKLGILPYFVQAKCMTPEYLIRILNLMYEEVESIRQNYKGGNFLFSQLTSVITMGLQMSEFKNAKIWEMEGCRKIEQEILRQFLPDGVHEEVTPGYHVASMLDFYVIFTLLNRYGKISAISQDVFNRLRNAGHFVMDLTYPGYKFDNFNDTGADGFDKYKLQGCFSKFLEMCPDDEELKWMKTEGKEGTIPSAETKLYPDGGYYMMRSEWWDDALMMVLKNNNTYGVAQGHCHYDNGTFSLFHKGRNFSPDPGYYDYSVTDQAMRDYISKNYDATNAHNTMTRNDENITGADHVAGKHITHQKKENYEVLVTENQSYVDLAHRRTVFFVDKKFFVMVDEGHGNANGVIVKLTFHLADDKKVVIDKDADNYICGSHTTYTDNNNMMFKTFVDTSQGYTVTEGVNDYSNSTRVKSGTRKWYRVGIAKQQNKAARFITVICPFETNIPNVSAEFTDGHEGTFDASGISVKVTVDGKDYDLSCSLL